MNQILQVKDSKLKKKSNGISKVLLSLFIIIIIYGLGMGGYYISQNIEIPFLVQIPKEESIITLNKTNDNRLNINVENKLGISKVIYTLNSEEPIVIELAGETVTQQVINLRVGENTISVTAIDLNGKELTKQEKIIIEGPKPIIDLSVVGNDIKITIESEVELLEVLYKWNSGTEKKENMKTYEDRNKFEKQLEIPIGQNTLTIVATDINGSKTEKVQEIKGITKPQITTKVDGENLHFTVKAKENISVVEFEFNGKKYVMNTNTFGETKEVHYKVKLKEGKNYLTVKGVTQSGGTEVISVEENYTKR